ncbi:phage tail assembly chaperone [Pseudoalteromonas piscicida]|uniref:phage tail assembly chaperone n=1 Tax=Pseudoalteromonas piscicida TaxID=43662 RepID=UPI0030B3B31F
MLDQVNIEGTEFDEWETTRALRDAYLRATDWMALKYQEMDGQVPQPLKDYRQALRDLPQSFESPDQVVWPTKPEL